MKHTDLLSTSESNTEETHSVVAIAGASGFVGQALGPLLSQRYRLRGLSRSDRSPSNGYEEFRQVDLFSLRATEAGLEGADLGIYLVHSMLPAARLVQGDFQDLDVLCAHNFALAAKRYNLKQIVYVGGLIPDVEHLSEHLESRLEVERVLASTGVPVTTIRAGMVVGANGSSYQLLARLVRRLPVMAVPSWTQTRMQPVAIGDLVQALDTILGAPEWLNRIVDIGAPTAVSYEELMAKTARSYGLNRRFIRVPLMSPKLSRLWVSMTTGAPKALVAPLIESLAHPMLARTDPQFRLPQRASTSVDEMLEKAVETDKKASREPRAFRSQRNSKQRSLVCSVQRMTLPEGRDAAWAAAEYFRWLPKAFKGLVRVGMSATGPKEITFCLQPTSQELLGLRLLEERSSPQRQVLTVTHGLLARPGKRSRLEFRQVLDGRTLIAGVHDFEPRLPWWLYRCTQGVFHKWTMNRFGRHLARLASRQERP
jgi:uncharacterized protein YbjT (DUF2867 family)